MDQQQNLIGGLKILDLVIMVACFTFAAVLASPGFDADTIREFMELRIKIGNFVLLTAFIAVWHLLFSAFGLYQDTLFSSTSGKAVDILKATSIGTCVFVALSVPFKISFVDARFILIFWSSASCITFFSRLAIRKWLIRYNRHEDNRRRVLIVGANNRSVQLAEQIETNKEIPCRVIGFVDDTPTHTENFERFGYKLVARYDELSEYLGKTAIDEVLVCLPVKSRLEDFANVVAICEEQGIAVGILRDLFKWNLASSSARQFGEQTIVTLHPHAINGGHAAAKRAIDIIVSASLIVLLSPVFIVTAIVIKLSSPGPVFFSQDRVGLNKKYFRIYKFRTMVPDAMQQQFALEQFNEAAGPIFKIKGDPRITPVGKCLRRTSIDELPQLVNVLKGEMSLVGPRPLPLRDYQGFSEDWHRRRVSVRPGITGLWQVKGRDQKCFDSLVKLDLEYIDRWSLMLDMKVLLMTIPAVLTGKGAV